MYIHNSLTQKHTRESLLKITTAQRKVSVQRLMYPAKCATSTSNFLVKNTKDAVKRTYRLAKLLDQSHRFALQTPLKPIAHNKNKTKLVILLAKEKEKIIRIEN